MSKPNRFLERSGSGSVAAEVSDANPSIVSMDEKTTNLVASPSSTRCWSQKWFFISFVIFLPAVAHVILLVTATRSTSATMLLASLLVMLVAVPAIVVLAFMCALCCNCDASSPDGQVIVGLFFGLLFLVPATAVVATFVPLRAELLDTDSHYTGPIPAGYETAFAASSANFYNLGPQVVVDHANTGETVNKVRMKNGARYYRNFAAPIHATPEERGSTSIPVWVCACGEASGCRNFPAIAVQTGPSRNAWRGETGIVTAVRIRSKKFKGICENAAANSAVWKLNATSVQPHIAQGAVFLELSDFGSLRTRLRTVIIATLVVLDFFWLATVLLVVCVGFDVEEKTSGKGPATDVSNASASEASNASTVDVSQASGAEFSNEPSFDEQSANASSAVGSSA